MSGTDEEIRLYDLPDLVWEILKIDEQIAQNSHSVDFLGTGFTLAFIKQASPNLSDFLQTSSFPEKTLLQSKKRKQRRLEHHSDA